MGTVVSERAGHTKSGISRSAKTPPPTAPPLALDAERLLARVGEVGRGRQRF